MTTEQTTEERPALEADHSRVLEVGSNIARDIIDRRSVRTINRGRDLPDTFSQRQRRRGRGMLFKVYRPNGGTSWCYRPDEPDPKNPGHKYEQPSKYYGAPGNVLDIHPNNHHLIADTSIPVIFVEGIKKADALATALRTAGQQAVVVAISGVWNFLSDGAPIPDMFDIPLEGRSVTIMFDSDMLTNPSVQAAAGRLAEHLTGRGSEVWITYFKDAKDGSKVGADDFFVAGGTVAELRMLTRRYDPSDFMRVRLSRDEKLRAAIEELADDWRREDYKGTGAHTRRAVRRYAIEKAAKHGKVTPAGVEVEINQTTAADALGTRQATISGAIKALQEEGIMQKVADAQAGKKAATYLLPITNRAYPYTERTQGGSAHPYTGGTTPCKTEPFAFLLPASSSLLYTGARSLSPRGAKGEHEELKRVRWSYVKKVRTPEGDAYQFIERVGKIRGRIIEYLIEQGGSALVKEVAAETGIRARDLIRRKEPDPDDPDEFLGRDGHLVKLEGFDLVTLDGVTVTLVDNWQEVLHAHRIIAGEVDDPTTGEKGAETLQKERHERAKRARRESKNIAADRAPTDEELARNRGHVRRLIGQQKQQAAEPQADERREKDQAAEKFVRETLKRLGRPVRVKLLLEMWHDSPDERMYLHRLIGRMGLKVRPFAEYDGQLFVYPPDNVEGEEPNTTTPPASPAPTGPPTSRGPEAGRLSIVPDPPTDRLSHGLDCECLDCSATGPKYAAVGESK